MTEKETSSKTYKDMLSEVETIVQDISSNEVDLDEMVSKVERGYELIQKMRLKLETTKEKIEELHKKYEEVSTRDGES